MAFLRDLAALSVVRVVGSFARGDYDLNGHLSDIDLYVLRDTEGMKQVIEVYDRHGVQWDSIVVGSIGSPRNSDYMQRPVEASYLFDGFKRQVQEITIYGVKFKAYVY